MKIFTTILKLFFSLALFLTPILLYMFNATLLLFIFTALIALYPLFNVLKINPLLNLSLHKDNMSFIPFATILLTFVTLLSSIYLWLGGNFVFFNHTLGDVNDFISSLILYLVAFTILLACKSLHTQSLFKKPVKFFLFALVLFVLQLLPSLTHYINYINLGIVTMLFLRFLYLLWKAQIILNRLSYAYIPMLFALTIFNELISVVDQYYDLPTTYIVLSIFIVYILISINLQHYLIRNYLSSSTKQVLYEKNTDLMNKFLTFKTLEVQNLEAEMSVKDNIYKQLFDFAPDAFVIFSEGVISYSNAAFNKLVGAKDSTLVLNKRISHFIHPDSIAKAKRLYYDLFTGKEDISTLELQVLSLQNNIKDVRVSCSITYFENNYYAFSSFQDLTSHYEQERLKLQLESEIAQEKFKVEFFANISHDLKTPINVIYSAVQLQDIYTHSNEYEKLLVYNNIIKQNCLRLQKLLNDILDITKIDANYFKPQPLLCNIITAIESITESITSYFENKNISITFDTNVEDKFVMTDPNLIERIILNLISNAIKYGKQDGHIWVTLFDEGNHLIISIKDDGIGIPKSHLSKIFNRFHKPDCNSDTNMSGNGIGLSLVKSIVEMLDGTIFCISNEGQGSEFILILPMVSHNSDQLSHSECATSLELGSNLNIELSDI